MGQQVTRSEPPRAIVIFGQFDVSIQKSDLSPPLLISLDVSTAVDSNLRREERGRFRHSGEKEDLSVSSSPSALCSLNARLL